MQKASLLFVLRWRPEDGKRPQQWPWRLKAAPRWPPDGLWGHIRWVFWASEHFFAFFRTFVFIHSMWSTRIQNESTHTERASELCCFTPPCARTKSKELRDVFSVFKRKLHLLSLLLWNVDIRKKAMSSELYIQEIKTVARYLCNGRPYSDSLYFINCGNKICNFYTKVLGHIFSKNLNRHQVTSPQFQGRMLKQLFT